MEGCGFIIIIFYCRRVHISEVTAKALGDQFQLEPGNGGDRDDYIQKHKIKTYLVVVPEVNIVYVNIRMSKNILSVKMFVSKSLLAWPSYTMLGVFQAKIT